MLDLEWSYCFWQQFLCHIESRHRPDEATSSSSTNSVSFLFASNNFLFASNLRFTLLSATLRIFSMFEATLLLYCHVNDECWPDMSVLELGLKCWPGRLCQTNTHWRRGECWCWTMATTWSWRLNSLNKAKTCVQPPFLILLGAIGVFNFTIRSGNHCSCTRSGLLAPFAAQHRLGKFSSGSRRTAILIQLGH